MNKITLLFERPRYVIKNDGWIAFIKDMFSSLKNQVFFNRIYYLSEGTLKEGIIAENPRLPDFALKIVSTGQEFERLVTEGFNFHPWYSTCRKRLNRGAILLCAFVGNELAHMSWAAVSEEGQKSLAEPPIKVDFANSETVVGGMWTKPKYRGMGIAPYASYKRIEYLQERGIVLSRGSIRKDNVASLRVQAKRGNRPGTRLYATGRHLKIMWWDAWKETPLNLSEELTTRK